MHEVLDSYGIDDENDVVFDLSNDPTEEEFDEVYDKIKQLLIEGQQNKINYLTIFLFAGHGILKNGMQCLVLNEYDEETQFYKLLAAEEKIRLYGANF